MYLCLDFVNYEKVFVVGHDWGAIVGWYLSLFRPDRVKALVNLSAPYFQRSPTARIVENLRKHFGDGCYVYQFQVYACIFITLLLNIEMHICVLLISYS